MMKILRGIVSRSPEVFDIRSTPQDGAMWISRTTRLQRYHVPELLQEWRKFGKADGALADFEMFVLLPVVIVQMNMLQAWSERLNAGLNAAIDVCVSSVQRAHHGGMADRIDESEMIDERGNDLGRTQLYVFNTDTDPAITGNGGASSQGIDSKLEGFLAQGLLRSRRLMRWRDDLAHVRDHHIAP
jgi:hypothetical protein